MMRFVQGRSASWGIVASAALACLIAAAPAAAAKDVRLSVKKVASPPEKAAAGDSFRVEGKLVNKGDDATRAKLTAELRGDGVSYRLVKQRTRVPAKGRKRFGFEAEVPARVEGSEQLKLVVCVPRHGTSGGDRCRKGDGRLTVTVPPTPPEPPPPATEYVAGSRSLGDALLPQLGNGGYDAGHYEIDLDYDPEREPDRRRDDDDDRERERQPARAQPRLPGRARGLGGTRSTASRRSSRASTRPRT